MRFHTKTSKSKSKALYMFVFVMIHIDVTKTFFFFKSTQAIQHRSMTQTLTHLKFYIKTHAQGSSPIHSRS